jgi:hypothetical protein
MNLLATLLLFCIGFNLNAAMEVEIDIGGEVFGYIVKNKKTRELLYYIPSSYKPESTGERDFCITHTKEAEISYSPNRDFIVITESNHRFIGDIFVLGHAAGDDVRLYFSTKLDEKVLEKTSLNWDRRRYDFIRWTDSDKAVLSLIGRYWPDTDKRKMENASFEVILKLQSQNNLDSVKRKK